MHVARKVSFEFGMLIKKTRIRVAEVNRRTKLAVGCFLMTSLVLIVNMALDNILYLEIHKMHGCTTTEETSGSEKEYLFQVTPSNSLRIFVVNVNFKDVVL